MLISNEGYSDYGVMTQSYNYKLDYMGEGLCIPEIQYINSLVVAEEYIDEYDEYAVTYENAITDFFRNIWDKIKSFFAKIAAFFKRLFGGGSDSKSSSGDSTSSSGNSDSSGNSKSSSGNSDSLGNSKPSGSESGPAPSSKDSIAKRKKYHIKATQSYYDAFEKSSNTSVTISGFTGYANSAKFQSTVMGIANDIRVGADSYMKKMYTTVSDLGALTSTDAKGKPKVSVGYKDASTRNNVRDEVLATYEEYKKETIQTVVKYDHYKVLPGDPKQITPALIADICRGKKSDSVTYTKSALSDALKLCGTGRIYDMYDAVSKKTYAGVQKSKDRLEAKVKDFEKMASNTKGKNANEIIAGVNGITTAVLNMTAEATSMISGINAVIDGFVTQTDIALRRFLSLPNEKNLKINTR